MKWASLGLALTAAVILILLIRALLSSEARVGESDIPASGMALIDSYRCGAGERRHVTVGGIEDDYASRGDEPARRHPRLEGLDLDMPLPAVDYDDLTPDTHVIDFFDFPSGTVAGLVVIKIKPKGDNANDDVLIGDFRTRARGWAPAAAKIYAESPNRLVASGRWKNVRDLYWASFADLPLSAGGTVLDLIQAGDGRIAIDIDIGDDTAVDFVAAVACERPPAKKGVTLVYNKLASRGDIAAFSCKGMADEPDCEPYTGDQPCTRRLPLLCFLDRDLPAPVHTTQWDFKTITRYWSGGEVAATAPVAADSFATIAAADRLCAETFGAAWRAAEWHDGGPGANLVAKSGGRAFAGRYWIDIRGAPYGTCWRRNDDAG